MIFNGMKPFAKSHPDEQIIEIISEGFEYDLHNAAEFLGVAYNLRERSASLEWLYYDHAGNIDKRLRLECSSVSDFSISEPTAGTPIEEDTVLEEIVYEKDRFLLFKFCSGRVIRVTCEGLNFEKLLPEKTYAPNP